MSRSCDWRTQAWRDVLLRLQLTQGWAGCKWSGLWMPMSSTLRKGRWPGRPQFAPNDGTMARRGTAQRSAFLTISMRYLCNVLLADHTPCRTHTPRRTSSTAPSARATGNEKLFLHCVGYGPGWFVRYSGQLKTSFRPGSRLAVESRMQEVPDTRNAIARIP